MRNELSVFDVDKLKEVPFLTFANSDIKAQSVSMLKQVSTKNHMTVHCADTRKQVQLEFDKSCFVQ